MADGEFLTPGGIAFRVAGDGPPLLLLHGLMVSGAMFDPLVERLRGDFRLIVPDLRGHGASGGLPGPYDVPALAADIPQVIAAAGCERVAVLGYSHGGAVAQQLARDHPGCVSRLLLACTYACNVATKRERFEADVLMWLLPLIGPSGLARLAFRPSATRPGGPIGLTKGEAERMRRIMGANRTAQMREAARGLISFDSRPWLGEIAAPTLVVAGADDTAVPRHHYDTLVNGIPGAAGRLLDRAEHTLIWTHTPELAAIVREHASP